MFERIDVMIAMGIAGIVNMSMLIIAASVFHSRGLTDLGDLIDPAGLMPGVLPISHLDDDGTFNAEVLWVDRYGNAQLNVDPSEIEAFGDRLFVFSQQALLF